MHCRPRQVDPPGELGGLLAQLQSGGGPLPPKLVGEIAMDVGLGQLTIPIDL